MHSDFHAGARVCLSEAIPEIYEAARHLDDAVSAHLKGDRNLAAELIRAADMPAIREWTDSIWGAQSAYVKYRAVPNAPVTFSKAQRAALRMPTEQEMQSLHLRDGYHCRFCGIPVIRRKLG